MTDPNDGYMRYILSRTTKDVAAGRKRAARTPGGSPGCLWGRGARGRVVRKPAALSRLCASDLQPCGMFREGSDLHRAARFWQAARDRPREVLLLRQEFRLERFLVVLARFRRLWAQACGGSCCIVLSLGRGKRRAKRSKLSGGGHRHAVLRASLVHCCAGRGKDDTLQAFEFLPRLCQFLRGLFVGLLQFGERGLRYVGTFCCFLHWYLRGMATAAVSTSLHGCRHVTACRTSVSSKPNPGSVSNPHDECVSHSRLCDSKT